MENPIKAIIENGDYRAEIEFKNLDEYNGACKFAQKLRYEDWGDIWIQEYNPIKKKIIEIDAKIAALQKEKEELSKNHFYKYNVFKS